MKNFLIGFGCVAAIVFFYLSIFLSGEVLRNKMCTAGFLTLVAAIIVGVYGDMENL